MNELKKFTLLRFESRRVYSLRTSCSSGLQAGVEECGSAIGIDLGGLLGAGF